MRRPGGAAALLALALAARAAAGAEPRLPPVSWSQDMTSLTLTFALPMPVAGAPEVHVNASHVRVAATAGAPPAAFAVSLALREDVVAETAAHALDRRGVRVTLTKRVPHRFDRLLADPSALPRWLLTLDAAVPAMEPEDDEDWAEEEPAQATPTKGATVLSVTSNEELNVMISSHDVAFLDARYPWCRRYGASRADMDAVVAAFPTAAAASGLPGRAVFLRADLLQARDIARRLDYPACEFRTGAWLALRSDEAANSGVTVAATPVNASRTARALAELLAPAVTLLPPGADAHAAAAAAAAAAPNGRALLAVLPAGGASDAAAAAFAAAAMDTAHRGTVRFLRASGGAAPSLRMYASDDADAPVTSADDVAAEDPAGAPPLWSEAGLARFIRVAALPLLPRYAPAMRTRLEAAALPGLKLFVNNASDAADVAALRATVLDAARALRGTVVAAEYDTALAYDLREFGLASADCPALGLQLSLPAYNSTRWALPGAPLAAADAPSAGAVVAWVRAALRGDAERAHVSERRAEAASTAEDADGLRRIVFSQLRTEALRPRAPAITLLELHASYFQRNHARTVAALRRADAALATLNATAHIEVVHMRRDVNHVPPEFELPTDFGQVGVYIVRAGGAQATAGGAGAGVRVSDDGSYSVSKLSRKALKTGGAAYLLRKLAEATADAAAAGGWPHAPLDAAAARAALKANAAAKAEAEPSEPSEPAAAADAHDEL